MRVYYKYVCVCSTHDELVFVCISRHPIVRCSHLQSGSKNVLDLECYIPLRFFHST